MALTVIIAKNQTGSPITLVALSVTIPASGQATISDFATTDEINNDAELHAVVDAGNVILNVDGVDLTAEQSSSFIVSAKEMGSMKHNFSATAAPTASDDDDAGYSIGSRWVDTVSKTEYVCVDDTTSSAVWEGATAKTGDLDLDGYDILNVDLIDGVDLSDHSSRHLPSGDDSVATAAAGTIGVGDVAAEGTAESFARSDHQHALTAPAAPADVTKAAASAGVATTVARSDHKHDVSAGTPGTVSVGDAAAEGSATSLARSDHTHALTAPAAPADVTKAAASAGVATTVARSDHKHNVSTAVASSVGASNAEGISSSLARADHTHAVTDLAIASQEQGSILYFDGSNWVELPPSDDGYVLTTHSTASDPTWETNTHTDDDAIHDNVSGEISAVAAKANLVSGDYFIIEDSEAANAKKSVTMGDIDHDLLTNYSANEHIDWTQSGAGTIHTDNYIEGGDGTDTTAIHDDTAGEISAITAKTPLVGADTILIEDSAAGDAKKSATIADIRITESQITNLDHTDSDAIHDNVSGEIAAIAAKTTLVSGDYLVIEDSEAANAKKSITMGDIDHDLLTNYAANEHIDWTQSGAGTIHTDNYIEGGPGTDTTAVHDNESSEISAVTAKASPVSGDYILIEDSEAANVKKSITMGDIDHDLLTNYAANEHIDWTQSGAGTIHTDNYIEGGDGTDTTAIHDDTAGEIAVVTAKASPVSGDYFIIEDSEAANVKKSITMGDIDHDLLTNYAANEHIDWTQSGAGTIHTDNYIEGGAGTDTTAIHDDTSGEINAITEKASPVGADILVIEDSAASYAKKKIQITNLPGGGGGDNISVNSTAASDANFNDTTPTAPAGALNVTWQKDTSAPDNISASVDGGKLLDLEFSSAGWLRKIGAENYEAIKVNLTATTNPGTGDDSSAGYAVGSRWINTTADTEFVCLDATTSAAVWKETTQSGGGAPSSSITEATGTTTTTSTTYGLLNSMTVTPAAGTYAVWFSAHIEQSNKNQNLSYAIYLGGTIVAASERTEMFAVNNQGFAANTMARVTVNGAQAIEIRWKVSTNTGTAIGRQLMIVEVS